jgi:thiopurine S-methyltransferase
METDFWARRWQEGRIGFHEGRPNVFLERYVERLGRARRVLVPLCGKTEDLAFLASRGHEVVGVEVVEDAARAFFAEHQLPCDVTDKPHGRALSGDRVTIVCGDLFAMTSEDIGRVDALYDRAALVALPPASRLRYVKHLRGLLGPGAPGLLITFEYATGAMDGPPFSVVESEVRALYAEGQVDLLDQGAAEGPRFREANAMERCFLVST